MRMSLKTLKTAPGSYDYVYLDLSQIHVPLNLK